MYGYCATNMYIDKVDKYDQNYFLKRYKDYYIWLIRFAFLRRQGDILIGPSKCDNREPCSIQTIHMCKWWVAQCYKFASIKWTDVSFCCQRYHIFLVDAHRLEIQYYTNRHSGLDEFVSKTISMTLYYLTKYEEVFSGCQHQHVLAWRLVLSA